MNSKRQPKFGCRFCLKQFFCCLFAKSCLTLQNNACQQRLLISPGDLEIIFRPNIMIERESVSGLLCPVFSIIERSMRELHEAQL